MPRTSIFTTCGLFRLSSRRPYAQRVYEALKASLGGEVDFSVGSRMEAYVYCLSMAAARLARTIERASDQRTANKVLDGLIQRESEWKIVPSPFDTVAERRSVFAARKRIGTGCTDVNVENALLDILGAGLLRVHTFTADESALWPAALGDEPMNLQPLSTPHKLVKIIQPISTSLGVPQAVRYTTTVGDSLNLEGEETVGHVSDALLVGDVIVVDGGCLGREEVVTVTAVSQDETSRVLIGTFDKAHDDGTLATTAPWPMWVSTKRHILIVCTLAAASDPELRRKVNEQMRRMLRGVTRWDIVSGDATGTDGPFKVGEGLIGITPLLEVTF